MKPQRVTARPSERKLFVSGPRKTRTLRRHISSLSGAALVTTAVVALAFAFAFAFAGAACVSREQGIAEEASADADPQPDAGSTRDGAASRDASTGRGPAIGPNGWILYTDYDPACGIYMPPDREHLPPPIAWEPCSVMDLGHGIPGPESMVCQKMAFDWSAPTNNKLSIAMDAEVVDGKIRLLFSRGSDGYTYQMVADLDGPVHQALMLTGGCLLGGFRMGGGNVMFRAYDTDATSSYWPGGAIGGPIDALRPRAYLPKGHLPSTLFSQAYDVGAHYFIESIGGGGIGDTVFSMDFGLPVATIRAAQEDQGMIYAAYRFSGDDAFWVGDSGDRTAIKVWNPAFGVKTLIGWPGDTTRAAASFATDGIDMVWMEAQGRTSTSYASFDFWTAKYSTNADVVASTKRHLLKDDLGSQFLNFVVGCGYAAIRIEPQRAWGQASGFRLIRLSDGTSWAIEAESLEQRIEFQLSKPLAISCDELLIAGASNGAAQVARIRLDSLGPGTSAP